MKYQDVEYGVQRLAPSTFLWTIYPHTAQRAKIESKVFHPTLEAAEAACRKVIDQSRPRIVATN